MGLCFLAATSGAAADTSAAVPFSAANTQRMLPVPPVEGRLGSRDLASKTAGTLLFQSTPDGGWEPVVDSANATGADKLLSADPSAMVDFIGGQQDFLFQFSDLQRVDRLAFRQQDGLSGAVQVFAADAPYPLESRRWRKLADVAETGSDPLVKLEFPPVSTRFLRLTFVYPEGGGIGSVFVASDVLDEDGGGTIPEPGEWPDSPEWEEFDFARSAAGGRVAYVGSGNAVESHQIVDADPETFFEFDISDQGALFIVELAETYPIYQASISNMEAIGSVEIWTFAQYPDEFLAEDPNGGETGARVFPSELLSQRPAIRRVDVPEDEEANFLTIPLPDTTARYLLVRVFGKSSDEPIRVSDFSVLGRVPREYFGYSTDRSNVPEAAQPESVSGAEPPPPPDPPRVPIASP